MRIGTPGFVAARLTEAREARGFTQTSLAELTGIKAQSISHYEQGRQSPSPDAMVLLSRALRLPERFFLRPQSAALIPCIFFQTHSRATARLARMRAIRRSMWTMEMVSYFSRYVELPSSKLPDTSGRDVEIVAARWRDVLGIGSGPVENLVPLLEGAGCVLTCMNACLEWPRAWSWWSADRFHIVLADADNYTVARELGHCAMHRDLTQAQCDNPAQHENAEEEADRFARAFLLPARAFAEDLWAPTVDALLALKKDWGCPVDRMVARCGELGLFNPAQMRRATAGLARRGRRWVEPLDEDLATARPAVPGKCIDLLLETGRKDRHSLLSDLALSAADIEEMCGLPAGYLATAHTHATPDHAEPRLRQSELLRIDSPDVVIAKVREPHRAVPRADGIAAVAGPLPDDSVSGWIDL